MHQKLLERFNSQADAWITDNYVAELRSIKLLRDAEFFIQDASLTLAPPWATNSLAPLNDIRLETHSVIAVQKCVADQPRNSLIEWVKAAANGRLIADQTPTKLRSGDRPLDYFSELSHRDRWTFPLHLQVQGDRLLPSAPLEATSIDEDLRTATPPFDGIADLSQWLILNGTPDGVRPSCITVNVLPPIELLFNESHFAEGQLTLQLRCSASADFSEIGLAVRIVPGTVAEGRLQVAGQIGWEDDDSLKGCRKGKVSLNVGAAISVLALLSYKGYSVARQWFLDSSKSLSPRHLAMIQFDPELKGLRAALFTGTDSRDFEKAVGCIAHLCGLSSALPLQSQTPDLIAAPPRGRQLVIECTIAISDFANKMGKLVDRCNALKKALATNNIAGAEVFGVLVCRQPADQIARDDAELRRHRILLISGDDLERALTETWRAVDPDTLLDQAIARWATQPAFD